MGGSREHSEEMLEKLKAKAAKLLDSGPRLISETRDRRRKVAFAKELIDCAKMMRVRLRGPLSLFEHVLPYVTDNNYASIVRLARSKGISLSPGQVKRCLEALEEVVAMRKHRGIRIKMRKDLDELTALSHDLKKAELETKKLKRVATIALSLVRLCARGLLKKDYGEGIADEIDFTESTDGFLAFARTLHEKGVLTAPLAEELSEFMTVLYEYDGTITDDLSVVQQGTRLACIADGPNGIVGILARQNTFQVAKHLLPIEVYVTEIESLAQRSQEWHQSKEAKLVRSVDPALPTPLRIASYCRIALSTHVLALLVMDDAAVSGRAGWWLDRVRRSVDEVKQSGDSGFDLAQMTITLLLAVEARLSGDFEPIEKRFRKMGYARAYEHLLFILDYEDCDLLVDLATECGSRVFPKIRTEVARS